MIPNLIPLSILAVLLSSCGATIRFNDFTRAKYLKKDLKSEKKRQGLIEENTTYQETTVRDIFVIDQNLVAGNELEEIDEIKEGFQSVDPVLPQDYSSGYNPKNTTEYGIMHEHTEPVFKEIDGEFDGDDTEPESSNAQFRFNRAFYAFITFLGISILAYLLIFFAGPLFVVVFSVAFFFVILFSLITFIKALKLPQPERKKWFSFKMALAATFAFGGLFLFLFLFVLLI